MARNFESRVAKVERQLAHIESEEKQASCICNPFVIVGSGSAEEFRAEMNRVCPAHGFRQLDILHIVVEDVDGNAMPDSEVNELLAEYNRRQAEAKQAA